ncbi:hypothetical protein, partial [Sulfoacidibacillus thermotolerans]|uniref:hypothetical protein n=1 Tax=Sulfoacidibacillus thermotolerans TaxID=1765684 RepID=UPI0011B2402D
MARFDSDDPEDTPWENAPVSPLPSSPSRGGSSWLSHQPTDQETQKNESPILERIKGAQKNEIREEQEWIHNDTSESEEPEVNEKKRAYEDALREIPHQAKELRGQNWNQKTSRVRKVAERGTKAAYFASKKLAPLAIKSTKRLARSPATASELA